MKHLCRLKLLFFQFLLIFRKAASGEISDNKSGLYEIYRQMTEVDVDQEGVKGAKNFFESKVCTPGGCEGG